MRPLALRIIGGVVISGGAWDCYVRILTSPSHCTPIAHIPFSFSIAILSPSASHSSHDQMSHSSNSSLLQQHRPESLPPQLPDRTVAISQAQALWLETHERTQQLLCKSRSRDREYTAVSASSHTLTISSPRARKQRFDTLPSILLLAT